MAVPERVLTNADLARTVDTTDEWIVSHTGIRERRIAGRETTASLSIEAARAALESADLSPRQLDLIIVATSTPEHVFPSTACLVQDALGAANAGAFDLSAACSGFVYAVSLAANGIRAGMHQNVLVIGAETLSRVTNWKDRGTCILFGDGAGAFVLQASATPGGVLASLLRADGSGGDALIIPAGGSHTPTTFDTVRANQHCIAMDGREVYRFATRVMASATREVVQDAGLTLDDIALIVPHQANRRIIDSAARALNLPEDRFVLNIDKYGNTSAASIPMALCEAVQAGRVRPNDHLVLIGFGGGLTWAATVIQWNVTRKPEVSAWRRIGRRAVYGLSKVRSAVRRGLRRVEGALPNEEAVNGNGQHPPEKSG
ncbi:MAG: ketoacyl-ACP synthase III [Anaerolineales bacterium]|nr:ketoacyl-ACP synthase III [Anaerolineales bacterium]